MQAVCIRSLVGELRFCMPYIRVKKQSTKKERFNLSKRENDGTTETDISRRCFRFSPLSTSRPPLLGSSPDAEVSLTFRMPTQAWGRVRHPNSSPPRCREGPTPLLDCSLPTSRLLNSWELARGKPTWKERTFTMPPENPRNPGRAFRSSPILFLQLVAKGCRQRS